MFIELSAYFYIFSFLLSFVAIYLNFQFIVREKKMPSIFIELSACFSLFSFLLLFLSISSQCKKKMTSVFLGVSARFSLFSRCYLFSSPSFILHLYNVNTFYLEMNPRGFTVAKKK